MSTAGKNWGSVDFDGISTLAPIDSRAVFSQLMLLLLLLSAGKNLVFKVDEKPGMEVSLDDLSQCVGQGKTEVLLEFLRDADMVEYPLYLCPCVCVCSVDAS